MRANAVIITLIVLALGLSFTSAWAQTPTTDQEEAAAPIPPQTFNYNGAIYTVHIFYDFAKALAGTENLEIKVWIETNGSSNIKVVSCQPCTKDISPFLSRNVSDFSQDGRPLTQNPPGVRTSYYHFFIGINPDAVPRSYQIKLFFAPENAQPSDKADTIPPIEFPLYVWVRRQGLLQMQVDDLPPNKTALACTGGESKDFAFTLSNNYVDYDVHVRQLKLNSNVDRLLAGILSSDHAGQIDAKSNTFNFEPPLIIPPGGTERVRITMQLAGIKPAGNYLTGYDSAAKITFAIPYHDQYQREPNDLTQDVQLQVSPSTSVLLVALLLGAVVGVVIMSTLKVIKYDGNYLRKASLIGSTILIGLLVSFLAWKGQINISFEAVDLRASYDKPWVLFVLSFVATVSGTPRLKKFLSLDKPGAGETPAASD